MGTLWQFFGFPDPETPGVDSPKTPKRKKAKKQEETPGQQLTLVNPDDDIEQTSDVQENQSLEIKDEQICQYPTTCYKSSKRSRWMDWPIDS